MVTVGLHVIPTEAKLVPVTPVLKVKVLAITPLTLKLAVIRAPVPTHIVAEFTVIVGGEFTVIVLVTSFEQPVTVFVPVTE